MAKDKLSDGNVFWKTAGDFIHRYLPDIQKKSPNTVAAYRDSLNDFLDFLERHGRRRKDISFSDFSRSNLIEYADDIMNKRHLAPKTENLRLTAIHSMLRYAAEEMIDVMPVYLDSVTVRGATAPNKGIEYFDETQMAAILAAPDTTKRVGRRNMMILVLLYDSGMRVSEVTGLSLGSLRLDAEVPYVTILGKGRKFRNVPLMDKTVQHLRRYLLGFHASNRRDEPLFYATSHGSRHFLSSDTVESILKDCVATCVAKGIGMPPSPHCHMIRKTRAMDLYQKGVPLPHIQQLLGHESISTTAGFYAFATLDTLAKAMAKMDGKTESITVRKWEDKEILEKLYRL